MKTLVSKSAGFSRIEFWALSTLFVFLLFVYIVDGLDGASTLDGAPYRNFFKQANVPFDYYDNYFLPQLLRHVFTFGAFLYLNFILIPKLLVRQSLTKNILLLVAIFIAGWILFGVTNTYLKGYQYASGKGRDDVEQRLFIESLGYTFSLLFAMALYTVTKYTAIFLIATSDAFYARSKFFRKEGVVAFAVFLIGLFLLVALCAHPVVIRGYALVVLTGILLYLYSFYRLIPKSAGRRYYFGSYLLKCIYLLLILFFVVMLFYIWPVDRGDEGLISSFFNAVCQLFITVPLTWTLYKRKMKGNEEITVLKKELKQSTANIDFLRSQINPHFLFNALNTLYGTAIQENADRTSEGIQMLGDMMRFMLQENMQEKISLSREIDYLNNYISLQRLRTDNHANIDIKTAIQDRETMYQVAPMLLIPFVENAFKHGISFREPSHIKVTLEIKDKTLNFDVYNSRHPRSENDPEKDKSGIGLENVKQRLKLLYPNKHELIIRETGKEFFVHLTIQLA